MEIKYTQIGAEKAKLQLVLLRGLNAAVKVRRSEGKGRGDISNDLDTLSGAVDDIQKSLDALIQSTQAFLTNYSQQINAADEAGAHSFAEGGGFLS